MRKQGAKEERERDQSRKKAKIDEEREGNGGDNLSVTCILTVKLLWELFCYCPLVANSTILPLLTP